MQLRKKILVIILAQGKNQKKKKLKFTSLKKIQLGGQGFLKGYKMSIFAAFAALRGPKTFKTEGKTECCGQEAPQSLRKK